MKIVRCGYVRLAADYCSSGLWGARGEMLDEDSLGLSQDLKAEILAWSLAYERSQFYYSPDERTVDFDTQAFNTWGENIRDKIAHELPGFTVEHQTQLNEYI